MKRQPRRTFTGVKTGETGEDCGQDHICLS